MIRLDLAHKALGCLSYALVHSYFRVGCTCCYGDIMVQTFLHASEGFILLKPVCRLRLNRASGLVKAKGFQTMRYKFLGKGVALEKVDSFHCKCEGWSGIRFCIFLRFYS